jgi:hypothetical protein
VEDLDIIGTMFGTEESSSRHDYLRHYDNLFARFRREQFNFIEIGVFNHASLATWRCYFKSANIIGLDSRDHDSCKAEDGIVVEVGSLGVFTAALEGVTHPVIRHRILARIAEHQGSLIVSVSA